MLKGGLEGGSGKVAYILTTSAAFNWLFFARKECF